MTAATAEDRGLLAVRRVRDARETDSRIGLQRALATQRECQERARAAERRLAELGRFAGGPVTALHAYAEHVAALARDRARTAQEALTSTSVAEEATRRWHVDRSRLRAVELLLQRRAADRAAVRDRRETRRLDDLAAQGWLRHGSRRSEEGNP